MQHDICNMIVYEPIGCAHRHFDETIDILKKTVVEEINLLKEKNIKDYLGSRKERYDKLGAFREL